MEDATMSCCFCRTQFLVISAIVASDGLLLSCSTSPALFNVGGPQLMSTLLFTYCSICGRVLAASEFPSKAWRKALQQHCNKSKKPHLLVLSFHRAQGHEWRRLLLPVPYRPSYDTQLLHLAAVCNGWIDGKVDPHLLFVESVERPPQATWWMVPVAHACLKDEDMQVRCTWEVK